MSQTIVVDQKSEIRERVVLSRMRIAASVTGSFTPGGSLEVVINAAGNRVARSAVLTLDILDDADEIVVGEGGPVRQASKWTPTVSRGSAHVLKSTVRFDKAGYYRLLVKGHADAPTAAEAEKRDTIVVNDVSSIIYVLIDAAGGHVTAGFVPLLDDRTRIPQYGSFGAFRPTRGTGSRGASLSKTVSASVAKPSAATQNLSTTRFSGRLMYREQDKPMNPTAPVANAEFTAGCYDPDSQWYYSSATSDADGYFTVWCFDDATGWGVASQNFVAPSVNSSAPGLTELVVSLGYAGPDEFVTVIAANDQAARVHQRLREYATRATTKFGASRSQIRTRSSNADGSNAAFYAPASDDIVYGQNTVFGDFGEFAVAHEYGHAFQYGAIETPGAAANCPDHRPGLQSNVACAYIEGFADFFSSYVAGDRQVAFQFSDWRFENPNYATQDGLEDEGRVAAFLYDLVDDGSEPDAMNNTSDGDDDTIHLPASWLVNVMRNCTLDTVTQLESVDHLIYCLEGSSAAFGDAARTALWDNFTTVQANTATPSGWNSSAIRQLWRFDLYSLGSLP